MVRRWFCQQRLEQVCSHDNKMAQLESQCPGTGDAELLCLLTGASQGGCGGNSLLNDLAQPFKSYPALKKGISFETV